LKNFLILSDRKALKTSKQILKCVFNYADFISNFPLLILYPAGPGFLFKTSHIGFEPIERHTNNQLHNFIKSRMSYFTIQFLNNSIGPILQGLALVLVDHCVYFVAASLRNQHVFLIHCGLLSSLRLVFSNAHQALGNYRNDIAYTAALKSTLAWAPIVLAQGNYRHDIAYTAALKSTQSLIPVLLAQGSYRYDIAYTAALKSIQTLAKGSYRQDIAYTGALKSVPLNPTLNQKTGATHPLVAPVFCFERLQGVTA